MSAPLTSTTSDADLSAARAVWSDPTQRSGDRVSALMGVMTVEEKLAQLGSTWLGSDAPAEEGELTTGGVAPMQEVFGNPAPWAHTRQVGIGHLTRVFGTAPIQAAVGAARLASLQLDLVNHSRLGIPAIAHEECLTGFTTLGATVYPTPLGLAATFDPDLVTEITERIGQDLRAVGVHQGLSPVLDVIRDARWGRVEESMGEDPYLVGTIATAYVTGLETQGIVATLKHFAGHAASRAARNHAPVSIGPREFADVHLVPFEMALRLGGARSVMNSYADVDGVPPAADVTLLTGLLRDQWGFEGTVVSDYGSVGFLVSMHRVAATPGQAGVLALTAGLDVELPETHGFGADLAAAVRAGTVAESLLDRALHRVLEQKVQLGLLDAERKPRPAQPIDLDSPGHRDLARRAAVAGIVMLDNDGILPFESPSSLAVIGPAADDPAVFLGCYSYPNHVLPRHPELGLGLAVPTLLDGIRSQLGGTDIAHATGVPLVLADDRGIAEAVTVATDADVVVLALGDLPGMFGRGSSGEGNDAANLQLPGKQMALANAVLDTGTPTVVVLITGRPYALGDIPQRASAVVQAFLPGEEGGNALADVLTGAAEPTGRLPIQIPTDPGGQPAGYLHPPLEEPGLGISTADTIVAYPFGHGHGWTSFSLTDIALGDHTVATDGRTTVAATVANTGPTRGTHVVQLYADDPLAEVVRPVRQLIGFAKVSLLSGAAARVTFDMHTDRLSYTGLAGDRIVDAGEIRLLIGHSSADLPLSATLTVTGPTRPAGHDRVLTTPATITALS